MAKKEMGPKERQLREMREARQAQQAQAAATAASKKEPRGRLKPDKAESGDVQDALRAAVAATEKATRRPRKVKPNKGDSRGLEAPTSEKAIEPTPVAIPDWQLDGQLEAPKGRDKGKKK